MEHNSLHILTCFFACLRLCSNSYVSAMRLLPHKRRQTKNLRDNAQLIMSHSKDIRINQLNFQKDTKNAGDSIWFRVCWVSNWRMFS